MLLMLKVIFWGSHRINVIFFIVLLFVDSKYYIFISIIYNRAIKPIFNEEKGYYLGYRMFSSMFRFISK
ncbi:hypothetical protein INE80_04196 [Bacteroides ovatus]|jgi:hypothetical protein|nr:hypothetical protein INE80_04196 [Bacteroides ovatus]CAG9891855.1 hypothetical protein BOVA514_2156 [Bacteroides ovatus]